MEAKDLGSWIRALFQGGQLFGECWDVSREREYRIFLKNKNKKYGKVYKNRRKNSVNYFRSP